MIDATTHRFDTFVFDLDGTLLDTLPDLVVLTNAVLRECGFPERTSAEILSYVGNGVKALMYPGRSQDADEEAVEAAMSRWKELYPAVRVSPDQGLCGHSRDGCRAQRRGARLGVLSNKFDAGVQDVVGAYLPGLFAVARGESADTPRKPDPTGLLRTIEELGVRRRAHRLRGRLDGRYSRVSQRWHLCCGRHVGLSRC